MHRPTYTYIVLGLMLDAVLNSHGIVAYLAVFTCLVAGAFGLPVPEDLSLITAGVLVHLGKAETWIMLTVCYVGILLGDLIIFRIGWMTGPALFRQRWVRRYMKSKKLHSIRVGLEKRTFFTILVARHLFYLRTATFLVCGSVRMSFTRFLIADAVAALITAPLMLAIGYLFAQNYELLLHYVHQVKIGLVIGGVITLAIVVVVFMRRRRRLEAEALAEGDDDESLEDLSPPLERSEISKPSEGN